MRFKIIGRITHVEIIAVGSSIWDLRRLEKLYGVGRWRKLKGFGTVQFPNGMICYAEIHWYEAHGIGKRDMKVKRIVGDRS